MGAFGAFDALRAPRYRQPRMTIDPQQLSLALAFVAGVVSFISPCVLALVPVYVAYLGETAADAAHDAGTPSTNRLTVACGSPEPEITGRASLIEAANFMTGFGERWGAMMATGTLIVLPVVVFAAIVSRHLVRGLTMGAVK